MTRIRMGTAGQLLPGKPLEKRILARRIMVVRDGDEIYAVEGDCKHMKASLSAGRIADGVVTCPMHNWQYDLRTGVCLHDASFKLKTYRVEIDCDDVYVIIE